MQKIQKIEEENLKNIRNIIRNLTPSEIESASITRLLSELCENTTERSGIECKFYAEETELLSKITTEQKLHIFRIIQESINNAIKHAQASEVSVIVRKENDSADAKTQGLLFMISDDGSGFSPIQEESKDIISQSTRLGIKGMKSLANKSDF